MAANYELIGRTVKINKDYAVTQRTGRNGVFESKMVMFTIATDRDYKQAVTQEDGSIKQENKTDFFVCRATGPIADLFNQYCSAKKIDENGKEKLVSRRLQLKGHIEKYNATRSETVQINYNGQILNVAVNLPEERSVLVVEKITFLDANPSRNNANGTTATTAQVVAQAINATPTAPVQMMTAPVAPVQQYVQPVAQVAPQYAQPVAQAMPTAPIAPQTISGEVAPF